MENTLTSMTDMLVEFHRVFGLTAQKQPNKNITREDYELRRALMREEFEELLDAMSLGNIEYIAKEGADVLYTVIGTLITYGIDADAVFEEVHRSNMTKLHRGEVLRNKAGKVMKSQFYTPANIAQTLENQRDLFTENTEEAYARN